MSVIGRPSLTEVDILRSIQALIVDMDGVLYRDNEPLPRLPEFFAFLRQHGLRFLLVTNNATRVPEQYVEKLAGMGVAIGPDEVLTSPQATAEYLAERARPGTRIYVVGTDGLRQTLGQRGFEITDRGAEYVVVGLDPQVTYEVMKVATLVINRGATFIATNNDPTYPTPEGLVPGCGAIVAAIETATRRRATVIGKPGPLMFETAMRRLGSARAATAVLGDQLAIDIAGGKAAGLRTIAVLSGGADRQEAQAMADLVFEDIGELLETWEALEPALHFKSEG